MQRFQFLQATTVTEALGFLGQYAGECAVIAGGTDLIPLLRQERLTPRYVLNILEIEELHGVTVTDRAVTVGPITTFSEIIASREAQERVPLLALASAAVGGPQIRNRGTIGGNITTASPAADVLPAVIALQGVLELRSRSATRHVPVAEALAGPYRTVLRPDELLTRIVLPKPAAGTRFAFEKLGRRKALTRARMNMSVAMRQDEDGIITEARVVPGAVMPVAQRVAEAEERLLGSRGDERALAEAAEAVEGAMIRAAGVRWSTEYKAPVIKNVFRRVVQRALRKV